VPPVCARLRGPLRLPRGGLLVSPGMASPVTQGIGFAIHVGCRGTLYLPRQPNYCCHLPTEFDTGVVEYSPRTTPASQARVGERSCPNRLESPEGDPYGPSRTRAWLPPHIQATDSRTGPCPGVCLDIHSSNQHFHARDSNPVDMPPLGCADMNFCCVGRSDAYYHWTI